MELTELAYMAGLFDGEGCIQIVKNKGNGRGRHYLRCSLEMTNEELPKSLQAYFGGTVRRRNLPLPRQNQWEWKTTTNTAYLFLKAIYPYLRLKKVEADVALEFQKSMHTCPTRLTEEELTIREAQRLLLSSLKRKS